MLYLVTKNPKQNRCYLEMVEDFEGLISILELTPNFYDIFATMEPTEAEDKIKEWRIKFNDCYY